MATDKQIKGEFKKTASKDPDKYYATSVLKGEGFSRKECKCGTYFWSVNDQKTCGDPACAGGFSFFDNTPAKNDMDYIEVWQEFARLFKKWGYTPIKRYPVVARWRKDTDFVQASIYDFQPYVVSGEVKPPANPLVVPQFCVRFNDIDNVGITGAHYTGFVMIGQHAFMPPDKWDQDKYFTDIHNWLKKGLGMPNEEITFHEDAWAGGGNFGACMEYFSRGLELGNQVYMRYEQTPSGPKELNLNVLDMGMGHERNSWFTKGTSTSYETTFPTVCKKLFSSTGIKVDKNIVQKFLPYASYLNVDEIDNVDKAWKDVAKSMKVDLKELRKNIIPLSALFSVGEHARSLLFTLNDGALPSNVGGGYNLRVILRRALGFIDKYGWKLDLPTICEWHAEYLKPLFPELKENLEEVKKILDVEKVKYENTKQKSKSIVDNLIRNKVKVDEKQLLELYDSNGIAPELIKEEAEKQGMKVAVPENFYARVTELHEKIEQEHATAVGEKLDLDKVEETQAEYFDDYKNIKFKAKILKTEKNKIILNKTLFYPTSGGQVHDTGKINKEVVSDVYKQGNHIVHVLDKNTKQKKGDVVDCEIDYERRQQLAQHHTATHLVNAAARRVLGNHINQAGAKKTTTKAHLDITHFQSLTDEELQKIEDEANKLVDGKIPVRTRFVPRDEAEKKYGMDIYQGGAVPGKELRIVEIPEVDIECCGGTHLHNTEEAGKIKILKSNKIQDGVVRITFTAGTAATAEEKEEKGILDSAAKLLDCKPNQVPSRANELFCMWKKVVKKKKDLECTDLKSTEEFEGDVLQKTSEILKTQPEYILKTIQRFKKEIDEKRA